MADSALLSAQAQGGIDGANAYVQAQQELAARRKAAVDQALAEAQGRGASQGQLDQISSQAGQPYDLAGANMAQQSADFTGDMARRQSRWNEYAHNVESARTLVDSIANDKAKLIDAQTQQQLALLAAQRRASGGGGGGGGGSKQKALTKAELQSYLGNAASSSLANKSMNATTDDREMQQFRNRTSASIGANMPHVAPVNQQELARRIDQQYTQPGNQRHDAFVNRTALNDLARTMLAQNDVYGPRGDLAPYANGGLLPSQMADPMKPDERFNGVPNSNPKYDEARQFQQLRNRLDAGMTSSPKYTPAQIERIYKQELRSAAPGIDKAELARRAMERKMSESRDMTQKRAGQAESALFSPQALIDEMVNVAATDPYLAGRFSPADLAEVVAPKVLAGDSAASYFDRVNGIDRAQIAKDNEKANKDQLEASKEAASQQLSMDMGALERISHVPWQIAATMITQDPDVQAAINDLTSAAGQIVDDPNGLTAKQQWDQLMRQARSQLNVQQYNVVAAVLSMGNS